jgi:hypothetical protein
VERSATNVNYSVPYYLFTPVTPFYVLFFIIISVLSNLKEKNDKILTGKIWGKGSISSEVLFEILPP